MAHNDVADRSTCPTTASTTETLRSPDSAPRHSATARLPGLDAIRVGAMALVIVSHAGEAGLLPRKLLWRLPAGVTAFFLVLSGFVLTTLLLRELDRAGRIDWPRFWRRRAARLLPGHFALVAVVIALGAAGVVPLDWPEVAASVTMTANMLPTQWTLGHTWSLALEWQFYALLALGPWIAGRHAWVAGAVLVVIGTSLLRAADPGAWLHGDALAWGVLAAYVHRNGIERPGLLWGKAALLLALAVTLPAWPGHRLVGAPLQGAGTALLILAMVNSPGALLTRIGESAPVRYLGGLSLSTFLVQQVWLDYRNPLPAWAVIVGISASALAMHYGLAWLQSAPGRVLRSRRCARLDPGATIAP